MTKILIVDDSATDQAVVEAVLKNNGYDTILANNAKEGIQKARAEKPDLILMDVVMPEMNGFQATRELSKDPETASIPIIIITSKDQETDRVWGMRQGASDYMVKPIDGEDLMAKVKTLLDGGA